MDKKQSIALIKDQLAAAGISKADIDLATETSEILLDLLATYSSDKLSDNQQKKSVKDLFEDAAASQRRAMEP